ncbi:MAG: succinyl-CoA:(S)- malate CoA transferase subunit A [Rhodospirillaceae bacterium]|nr:MAG: succinyl-CoA:(S)- malate CoA transferase subunit A [Rhodospirillaceae bacterium]
MVPGSNPLGDYMSGLYGVIGILLALRQREKTGRGQMIDVGIYEAVFRQLDEIAAVYGMFGRIREREGAGTVIACPHGHFRTKDDRWVAIACTTDKMFARLVEDAMGRPELASSGLYGIKTKRLAARKEVDALVSGWTMSLSRDDVMQKCIDAEVPIGQINSIADIFADPHFRARSDLVTVTVPDVGDVMVPGVFPKLSRTPGRIATLGPRLGEHTKEVLGALLDLTPAELKELRESRVI